MNITSIHAHAGGLPLLGVAVLAVALLGTSACGSDAPVQARPVHSATIPSSAASSTAVPTVARPTATVDELVGTTGSRVHVRCIGRGDTTVVLIAGFGGDLTTWASVEPAISAHTRVCSYDRPGTGTSDPARGTTTFGTQATELHALLHTIGEPGPYLVVGHSFGGAQAVTFASQFPAEVVGLVLVDASPATWPAALCAVADDGSEGAAMLRAICSSTFPPDGNGEHLDVHAAFAEVARITSLGALPMAVITATDRALPADLADGERARLTDVWNQGQQAWVALATTAHFVPVDHTGHHIEIDRPSAVIDEITRLLP